MAEFVWTGFQSGFLNADGSEYVSPLSGRDDLVDDEWSRTVAEFLKTQSRTEEPAMPDQSRNPYDRRRDGERTIQKGINLGLSDATLAYGRAHGEFIPRALAIEDLDAMASSAHARGEVRAQERLMEAHRIELQAARREAWEEGRAQGEQDGLRAMLRHIDAQAGEHVRSVLEAARGILSAVGAGQSKITKRDLETALDSTVDTLARLVSAHHHDFLDGTF